MIQGNFGIYALYKNKRLYYIGLANNFKQRLTQHLNDRHSRKWDTFSLYTIRKQDHIREIEAMMLRIADPTGNSQKGKLRQSVNLLPELNRQVKVSQDRERETLLGKKRLAAVKASRAAQKKKLKTSSSARKTADNPLKGLFPGGKRYYAAYKNKEYKAVVMRSGTIKYNGQLYDTPTAAAKAILGNRAVNGWWFWKYQNASGDLVRLKTLKK